MNRGVTLVELMVVLLLLGLMLSVAALALRSAPTPTSRRLDEMRATRAEAIRSGVPRSTGNVLFLPDGRAIGDDVDPLTGAPDAQ